MFNTSFRLTLSSRAITPTALWPTTAVNPLLMMFKPRLRALRVLRDHRFHPPSRPSPSGGEGERFGINLYLSKGIIRLYCLIPWFVGLILLSDRICTRRPRRKTRPLLFLLPKSFFVVFVLFVVKQLPNTAFTPHPGLPPQVGKGNDLE